MAISQKSYNKMSNANKYAFAQNAKKSRYHSMAESGILINWQTTHLPYNKGLTKLGELCKERGIPWVK